MTEITKQLMRSKGFTERGILDFQNSNRIIYFKEYDYGFLSFIEDWECYVMFSLGINDTYGYSMWKDIIKFIDNRDKPVLVSFDTNKDRLFRAASRYDYEIINEFQILIK